MLRREVLTLYRDFIRTCRKIEDKSSQRDMIQWVRADFRKSQHVQEEVCSIINHHLNLATKPILVMIGIENKQCLTQIYVGLPIIEKKN